jgi:HSP20 family molecular chaperone IbpA
MLVIEAPIQNPENERRLEQVTNNNRSLTQFGQNNGSSFGHTGFLNGSDAQPRIVDNGNNQRKLEMIVEMKNYRPEEIKVSVTNKELIIQGEHQHSDGNRSEKSSFFRSTTLPPGTQVDQLQSYFNDDGQLKIEAPCF